ncbi:protein PFC0760c isoform X1 [Sphaeramia orbicularis]|uniref:protein PFC0760c isoform X1 n=1 Tax=Sphaeramia orbicularis TaxID=375764 RepID=UPI00117EBFD4|nr:hydrolethalus syndrome protein 1 isoform X1 [Sphaeramia orbicularis]
MYKMYSAQSDKESDDDNNSLNSSFWSDGERQDEEDEEERVEIQQPVDEEESKPAAKVEESLQEDLGEEKPELNKLNNVTEENPEERTTDEDDDNDDDSEGDSQNDDSDDEDHDDDHADDDDEDDGVNDGDPSDGERCSSSSGSPAPSLMTSGYGTYRPEEQEAGDYRDNHTITEFDQDSQGDLSEVRDDDDDRSLCSFGGFDIEPTHDLDYESAQPLQDDKLTDEVVCYEDPHEEVNFTNMKVEQVKSEDSEEKYEDLTDTKSEEHHHHVTAAEDRLLDGDPLGSGSDYKLNEEYETPEAEEQQFEEEDNLEEGGSKREDDLEKAEFEEESSVEKMESKEENNLKKVESEGEDDSSSNKDIKFIDSKVDLSWSTYRMLEEWEGNLRPRMDAASRLEERLADLHLSPSAQHDSENEDVTSRSDTQSSEAEGMSLTAFESYIRTMTRTRSDGDIRPKPKSFIRPVLSQPIIKKTDPVAKYFQYKQLWEMFKLPGEKDRRDLRWEIRERLAYQPPPPKPRRVFVPNTYTVPTEKKRSALRWEIRNDLANGLLPHKYSYRF